MKRTFYWILAVLASLVGYMLASRRMEDKRDFR
ncbi:hypothetical protein SAMN05216389_10828 [Oceanobacillus limi]|uniref:Uncharacterized protein n=1 Tax=Oceanobacillus limi TaxID=930131 RepID=A0A1I0D7T6_9BACI|nr:hypothetical protein SAMN05216389_10828 [Oceanobacillus limi]